MRAQIDLCSVLSVMSCMMAKCSTKFLLLVFSTGSYAQTAGSPPPPTGLSLLSTDAKICLGPEGAQCCVQYNTGVLNSNCPLVSPNLPPFPPADPPASPPAPPALTFDAVTTGVTATPGTYMRTGGHGWGGNAYDSTQITGLDHEYKGISFRCPFYDEATNPDPANFNAWSTAANGHLMIGLRPYSTSQSGYGAVGDPRLYYQKDNNRINIQTASSNYFANEDWTLHTYEIRLTSTGIQFAKDGVVFHSDSRAISFPVHAAIASWTTGCSLFDVHYLTAADKATW